VTVEHGARRFAIVASVIAASALFIFYSSVVAVAYPQITGNLGASGDEGTWIIDAFLLSAVIAIPLAPWLQARLGRRRYATLATAGFAATTLFCGLATSPAMLIALRFAQGAFGGGLAPLAQAILRDTLPAKDLHRGQALFAVSVTFGGALAPYLGGLIADDLSWPWIFYAGVPVATAASVILARLLIDPGPPEPRPLDIVGLVLLVVALSSLLYLLVEGERWDWLDDGHNLVAAVLAIGGVVAFLLWSLKARWPIVDLRVMRRGNTAVACVLAAVFGFGLYGLFVLEPLSTQSVIGLTATLSGVLVTVQNLVQTALLIPITSLLAAKRVGPRLVLAVGFLAFAFANMTIAGATTTTADFGALLVPMVLGGIGPALIFAPLPAIAVEGLRGPHDVSTAAALFNLSRILGGSVGVALVQALVDRRYAFHEDVLAGAVTTRAPAVVAFLGAGHQSLERLSGIIVAQSNALADADGFRAIALVAACSVPFVLLLRTATYKN